MIRLRGPAAHLCIVLTTFAVLIATIGTADAVARASSAPGQLATSEPAAPVAPVTYASGLIVRTTAGAVTPRILALADSLGPVDVTGTSPVATGADTIDLASPVTLASAESLARKVEAQPGIVSAEPNRIISVRADPPVARDDFFFSRNQQFNAWDRRSTFAGAQLPKGGYSTRAPYLWRATNGRGAVVAVIDTGITAHPDLMGRTVKGYDFYSDTTSTDRDASTGGVNKPGRDSDASDPGDYNDMVTPCDPPAVGSHPSSWHGTHVAGIIAASGDNQIGVTGLAASSKVQPIRVLGPCGGSESDIADAIVWAAGGAVEGVPVNPTPARVINLSLGTSNPTCGSTFANAITEARRQGAVVVVAAGNESTALTPAPVGAPATCDGAISVAASNEIGQRAVYSSVGPQNDLSAPGGDERDGFSQIVSTINAGERVPVSSGTYAFYAGTSMATPAVAAGAALMSSLGYRRTEIEQALKYAVQPFPQYATASQLNCTTSTCGRGVLDLSKVPAPYGSTQITGRVSVGRTVGVITRWTGSPRLSYQWFRSGRAIGNARFSRYRVQSSDRGRTLTVRVVGVKPGFKTLSKMSAGRRAR